MDSPSSSTTTTTPSSSSSSSSSQHASSSAYSAPVSRVGSYATLAALSLARPSAHSFPVVLNANSGTSSPSRRSTDAASSSSGGNSSTQHAAARRRSGPAIAAASAASSTSGSETETGGTTSESSSADASSSSECSSDTSDVDEEAAEQRYVLIRRASAGNNALHTPRPFAPTPEASGSRTPMPFGMGSGGSAATSPSASSIIASSYFAQDAAVALARAAALQLDGASRSSTPAAAEAGSATSMTQAQAQAQRRRTSRTRSRTAGSSPLLPATSLLPLTTNASGTSASAAYASATHSPEAAVANMASRGSAAQPMPAPLPRTRSRSWVSANGLAFTPRNTSPTPFGQGGIAPLSSSVGAASGGSLFSRSSSTSARRARANSGSSTHSGGTVSSSTTATQTRRHRVRASPDGAGSETEAEADALGLGIALQHGPGRTFTPGSASRHYGSRGVTSSSSANHAGAAGASNGYFGIPLRQPRSAGASPAISPLLVLPQSVASASMTSARRMDGAVSPEMDLPPPPYSPSRPASPPRFESEAVASGVEAEMSGTEGLHRTAAGRRARSASCGTQGTASMMSGSLSLSPTSLVSPPQVSRSRVLPAPPPQDFIAHAEQASGAESLLYSGMSASSAWVMRWLLHPLRLLAAVPGVIGTMWLLRMALLTTLEQGVLSGKQEGRPSAAQFAVASLWSISTAYHALSFTTLLLRRWLADYALPSSLIRLLALQAICWPLVRCTVTSAGPRNPLAAWVVVGTTTAVSDTVARWVTSNIADKEDDSESEDQEGGGTASAARSRGYDSRSASGSTRKSKGSRRREPGRWFWRAVMGAAPRGARIRSAATTMMMGISPGMYEDFDGNTTSYAAPPLHPRTLALSTSGLESEWDSDFGGMARDGTYGPRSSEAEHDVRSETTDVRSDVDLDLDLSSPEELGLLSQEEDFSPVYRRHRYADEDVGINQLRRGGDAYDDRLAASRTLRSAPVARRAAASLAQQRRLARAQYQRNRSIRDKHPARVFHWGVALRRNVLPIAILGYTSMWILLLESLR